MVLKKNHWSKKVTWTHRTTKSHTSWYIETPHTMYGASEKMRVRIFLIFRDAPYCAGASEKIESRRPDNNFNLVLCKMRPLRIPSVKVSWFFSHILMITEALHVSSWSGQQTRLEQSISASKPVAATGKQKVSNFSQNSPNSFQQWWVF